MNRIFKLAIIISFLFSKANAQGILFQSEYTWEGILKEAKEKNLYIFVDCYTTWCGPCVEMDREVFPQKSVGDFVNQRFLSIRIQMDTTEKDAPAIKKEYSLGHFFDTQYSSHIYPEYLIFNPDGVLVHRVVGAVPATEFLRNLETAFDNKKRSTDPQNEYHRLQKELARDPNNKELLKSLTYSALRWHDTENASRYSKMYIASEKKPADSNYIRFVLETVQSAKDTGFQLILNEPGKYEAVFGKDILYSKLAFIVAMQEILPKIPPDFKFEMWDTIASDLRPKYPPVLADLAIAEAQSMYYTFRNDWVSFSSAIDKYSSLTYSLPAKLNDFASVILRRSSDTAIMRRASNWSLKAFKNSNNPVFLSTYARLLYKMGHISDAMKFQDDAIALSRMYGMDKDWGILIKEKMKNREQID